MDQLFATATINVDCSIDGCSYSTGEVSESIAVVLLSTHVIIHTNQSTVMCCTLKPKLDRPKVNGGTCLKEGGMYSELVLESV